MKKGWKKAAVIAAGLMLGGTLTSAAKETEDLQKVTVILDYVPNTNHTGMYVALDKGYYEEEGLEVEIIESTDGATATLVAQGKGTFGVSYQEDITIALTAKDPLPVKAVATLVQHNTSGFVSLADSGIESPADFAGKTYAGWGGPGESAVLEACMTQAGTDFSELNMVISDGSGFEALGKSCDIMWFFEGWDCITAELKDCKLNYMACRELDERLDYYTPILITSDQILEEEPELVASFLRATQKGYLAVIADPEAAAELLYAHAPQYDLEVLKRSQAYLSEHYMEDTNRWGEMKAEVWENYAAFLLEYGVIDHTLSAEDCYTNDFLPEEQQ